VTFPPVRAGNAQDYRRDEAPPIDGGAGKISLTAKIPADEYHEARDME
jgi:hypothetical protein